MPPERERAAKQGDRPTIFAITRSGAVEAGDIVVKLPRTPTYKHHSLANIERTIFRCRKLVRQFLWW
jgi:hypothetical protein